MKRMLLAALAALAITGAASAQNANPPSAPNRGPDGAQLQQTTISGKLEWIDGSIGLKSGGNTYFAPRVRQLVGFVKDLQEGATVSLTGYAEKVPYGANSYFFMATKLSLNGKDYDFAQAWGPRNRGFGDRGQGMGQGMRGPGNGNGNGYGYGNMDLRDCPRW